MKGRRAKRPGLAKTRAEPLVSRRSLPLVKSCDYRFRELFENADVISEGKTREDGGVGTYYGSTSILLPLRSQGGFVPDGEAEQVLAILGTDPHARVRAVRIACLEAQVRAGEPIGQVRAELAVHLDTRGLRVHVEVEAPVFARGREASVRSTRRSRGGRARS